MAESTRLIPSTVFRSLPLPRLAVLLFLESAITPNATAVELETASDTRTRMIVLTDIGGDPDDQQSMVRLLLYANEFQLEGLIATALKDDTIHPEMIRERIEAYRKVYPDLTNHAGGYPTPDKLLTLVKAGCLSRMTENTGQGKSTEGSRHIMEVVDRDDPRPVWVTVWGAATDLAQALWDVKNKRSPKEAVEFVSKLRVYDIAGQDDGGAWICHTFPEIFYLRSVLQFQGISVREARPFPPDVTGANIETFTTEWVADNVISHGPLGALYVERKWKYEGDTPAFLYLLPNGLSDPEQMSQGNWGGRFDPVRMRNAGAFNKTCAAAQLKYHDYSMFTEAADTWSWGEHTYKHNTTAALFRWREEFQNDFAARMDWSITSEYEKANHNPIAAFAGQAGSDVIYLTVKQQEKVPLSAAGTRDPDGDRLEYCWWHYPEPGTFHGDLIIDGCDQSEASFVAPKVFSPVTIHVILTVRDTGTPALYNYRRAVVTVNPN